MAEPFWCSKLDGLDIISLEEKLIDKVILMRNLCMTVAFDYLKKNEKCDMPMLFEELENLEIEQWPIWNLG